MNRLIEALLLIRLGQELGADSRLARAVADIVEIALQIAP